MESSCSFVFQSNCPTLYVTCEINQPYKPTCIICAYLTSSISVTTISYNNLRKEMPNKFQSEQGLSLEWLPTNFIAKSDKQTPSFMHHRKQHRHAPLSLQWQHVSVRTLNIHKSSAKINLFKIHLYCFQHFPETLTSRNI